MELFPFRWILAALFLYRSEGYSIVTPPSDVTAVAGSNPILICKTEIVEGELDAVEWSEYLSEDFGNRIFVSLKPTEVRNPEKYAITGEYDLLIKNAALNDGGQYACSLISDGHHHSANLVVIDEPFLMVSPAPFNINENSAITCQSFYGAPDSTKLALSHKPQIHITVGGQNIPVTVSIEPRMGHNSQQFMMTATTNYTVKIDDHQKEVVCNVTTEMPAFSVAATEILDVKYPVRDIMVTPEGDEFGIGTKFVCEADGNPLPTFTWRPVHSNGARIVDGPILEVTPDMIGHNEWTCIASNTVWHAEVQEHTINFEVTIEATVPPTTTKKPPVDSPIKGAAGILGACWSTVTALVTSVLMSNQLRT